MSLCVYIYVYVYIYICICIYIYIYIYTNWLHERLARKEDLFREVGFWKRLRAQHRDTERQRHRDAEVMQRRRDTMIQVREVLIERNLRRPQAEDARRKHFAVLKEEQDEAWG